MCFVSSFSCQHFFKPPQRKEEGGKVLFYFSPFEGSCLFAHNPVYLYRNIWFLFLKTILSAAAVCQRSCPTSSLRVPLKGINYQPPLFLLFRPLVATHSPNTSANTSTLPSLLLRPLLLPPSLPPSSTIDAGSHTCHLSLLIMHGRCCWCGLSHWDWERQEWQHCAA